MLYLLLYRQKAERQTPRQPQALKSLQSIRHTNWERESLDLFVWDFVCAWLWLGRVKCSNWTSWRGPLGCRGSGAVFKWGAAGSLCERNKGSPRRKRLRVSLCPPPGTAGTASPACLSASRSAAEQREQTGNIDCLVCWIKNEHKRGKMYFHSFFRPLKKGIYAPFWSLKFLSL